MECHEIEISILPDGQVKAHIKGAKGQACMDYVKLLEQILGGEGELERTTEYYEPPTGVEIHIEQKNEGGV